MSENKPPLKIEFAPGCFDHFEGTQEELDALISEITTMFETMTPEELEANGRLVDIDELMDSEDWELIERLANVEDPNNRKLQ